MLIHTSHVLIHMSYVLIVNTHATHANMHPTGANSLIRTSHVLIHMSHVQNTHVLTVKCQAHSLLGRLEALGPGSSAAAGRRWQAAELERCWRKEERAHTLATAQGWSSYRTGFGKLV